MGLVQLMTQEEIAAAYLRLSGCSRTAYTLIGVKGLKSLNAGVEGAVLARVIACCAVPAAVIELFAEEVVDEAVETAAVVPMSGCEPHQHRDNAGLQHPPSAPPLPESLTPGKRRGVPGRQAKPDQMQQRVRRGSPLRRVVAATPAPVVAL